MKAINYLGMMMAAAAITACTSEDLVDKTASGMKETPMTFSAGSGNMTRISSVVLNKVNGDFGVYALKYVPKTDGSGNKWDDVMVNYQVMWDATNSKWYYAGIGDNTAMQYLKYWDKSASDYEFYAYTPYNSSTSTVTFTTPSSSSAPAMTRSNATYGASMSVSDFNAGFAKADGTLPTCTTMFAYQKAENASVASAVGGTYCSAWGYEVPLLFKRLNGKVQFAFTKDAAYKNYELKITSVKLKYDNLCTGGSVTFTSAGAKFNGSTYGTTPKELSLISGAIDLSTTTEQDNDENYPAAETTYETVYTPVYYCVPSVVAGKDWIANNTSSANSNVKVEVTYTFKVKDYDNEKTPETITVTSEILLDGIEGDNTVSYCQWEPNHSYTYEFTVGLKPIVFNGVKVEDYNVDSLNQDDQGYGIHDTGSGTDL